MRALRLLALAAAATLLLAACSRNPNDDFVPRDLDRQVWTASVSVGDLLDIPGIPSIPGLPIGVIPSLYIDVRFSQELGSPVVSATISVNLRAEVPIIGTIGGDVANLGTSTGQLDFETGVFYLDSDSESGGTFDFDGRFRGFRLQGEAVVNGVAFNTTFTPRVD